MGPRLPEVEVFRAKELGNSSFLVADPEAGSAVAIDPARDVDQYLGRAEHLHVRIERSLETHVHNDFISGSRELQAEVGATITAAAGTGLEYAHVPIQEGQEVSVGRFRLRARHTPGHTPEHISYLLLDEAGKQLALFSGGAIMVGAIARTDLFGPHLATQLALEAYRTIHVRLRHLPDDVAVYPTHGGGSFCAASSSNEATTSMGAERKGNPYMQTHELMPFIARALHQGPYPRYYREMAALNRKGVKLLGRQLPRLRGLSADLTELLMRQGAAVVDLRPGREYDRGHIPGSYCVGMEGPFSAWVGWIVPRKRVIVLVGGDKGRSEKAYRQLLRIGYDNVGGYLEGGLDAWTASGRDLNTFETAEIDDLATWILSA